MDPGQFETPWVEYTKRMDPEKYVKFVQCFHQLIQGTNLKEANSMLSIGIGHGEFETLIVEQSLPAVNHVIAVEPDVKFNSKIIKALQPPDGRKIKVDIENTMFESYKGPDNPVDLIILGNVLMYVPDKEQEVTRCLQWLKPGGHLLIIGRKCTRADLLLREMREDDYSSVNERKLLEDRRLNYRHSTVDVWFDLHGSGLREALYVSLNRIPSQKQVENFLREMEAHFIPGTEKIYFTYSFYLASKSK